MSLSSLLSIARTALVTQQRAIDTTGHNVANAQTEGYSRQRLNIAPATPLQLPFGQVGRGVNIDGIERVRSRFLDGNYRTASGDLGNYSTRRELLGTVEGVFGEPSDTGLATGLDDFFNALDDLANEPTGKTQRTMVRTTAQNLVTRLHDTDSRINAVAAETVTRMRDAVSEINRIAAQIADLNVQVRAGNAGNRQSPDVQDRRDLLVDELSKYVGVRVLERQDGTIGVTAGDVMIVDAGQHTDLELRNLGDGAYSVGLVGSPGTVNLQTGQLAALAELSSTTLPGIRARLNGLVQGMVTEVNAIHRAGRNLTGATGIDFFDPTGLTASSVQLSQALQLTPDNIAAGRSGGSGDNANALALAALRTNGVTSFGGQSIGEAYQALVSDLGVAVKDASQREEAQDVIANNADSQRKSVSGVSIDEELTQMIAQQNAYSAAARLVSVADEMMQAVLGMVR
ncbi:MAG: flagellar hook-associated protein FlgK [Gemmatimonadetes bacterium]|nr:flagellar hook-associated protein FlgK [Gemmatimonadota bacterium]